jgi:hypothetical protein
MLETVMELIDVKGRPKVRLTLPGPLRIGDRVRVCFRLQKRQNGRSFVLDVNDGIRVVGVSFDASTGHSRRQILAVECPSGTPTCKAIRNPPARILPPTRFPPTRV